jgi:hypothetical protein
MYLLYLLRSISSAIALSIELELWLGLLNKSCV